MGKAEAVKENLKPEVEVTKQLLTKLAEPRFEKLDAAVVNAAKRGIIDGLGVAIAGSITTTGQIIRDYAVLEGGNGNCALIGDQRRCAPALSALANGTIAHALDFDDVQWQMIGHPT